MSSKHNDRISRQPRAIISVMWCFRGCAHIPINKWVAKERKREKDVGWPLFPGEPGVSSNLAIAEKRARDKEKGKKIKWEGEKERRRENVFVLVDGGTKYECRKGKCSYGRWGGGRCLPQKPLSATYWIRRASFSRFYPVVSNIYGRHQM